MTDAWQEKVTPRKQPAAESQARHVGMLGVTMLRVRHDTGTVLIGYSFIRRVELTQDALFLYASECIVQVVGSGLEALLTPLQNHQLDSLAIGERGITHITLKADI